MFLCLKAVFKFTVHYDFDFTYINCNLFFQYFITGPYINIILCVIQSFTKSFGISPAKTPAMAAG